MTKICTSIEQSKKLLELGLNPNSADMYYSWIGTTYLLHAESYNEIIAWRKEYAKKHNNPSFCTSIIPCWSLAGLLGMIPLYTLEQTTDGKVIVVSEIGQYSKCSEARDNPIDAAFEIVCWLIEQKHIKVNK